MRRDEEASNVVLASSIVRAAGRREICIAVVGGWGRSAPVVEEGLSVTCGVGGESGVVVCVRYNVGLSSGCGLLWKGGGCRMPGEAVKI